MGKEGFENMCWRCEPRPHRVWRRDKRLLQDVPFFKISRYASCGNKILAGISKMISQSSKKCESVMTEACLALIRTYFPTYILYNTIKVSLLIFSIIVSPISPFSRRATCPPPEQTRMIHPRFNLLRTPFSSTLLASGVFVLY